MPNAEGLGGPRCDPFVERQRTGSGCRPRTPDRADPSDRDGKARRHHPPHRHGYGEPLRGDGVGRQNRPRMVAAGRAPDARAAAADRQGDIGKAFAVAISPDGVTVAVGGSTGYADHVNIFLFDRASGELKQRLRDLPNVVNSLGLFARRSTPRGIAGGSDGIRVFDAGNDYRPMPSDTKYGGPSYWAAFDRSGRLVTVSDDGFVRLYAMDSYDTPIARFRRPGHDPIRPPFHQTAPAWQSAITIPTMLWSSRAPT